VILPVTDDTLLDSFETSGLVLRGLRGFYDLLDGSGKSLVGHTHIVSSPHDIGEIVDPFKVRVSLVRGTETDVSPQVDSIRATACYCTYLPIVVKSVHDG
jgi:hypothetical protein